MIEAKDLNEFQVGTGPDEIPRRAVRARWLVRRRLLSVWPLLLLLMWTLSGCESREPPPPAAVLDELIQLTDEIGRQSFRTVSSADGSAHLLIGEGTLPKGLDPSALAVTRIDPAQVDVSIDGQDLGLAFRLEPDGLQFARPVLLRFEVSTASNAKPLPYLIGSGGDLTALPAVIEEDQAGGRLVLTTAVTHFSVVGLAWELFYVLGSDPSDHLVGQTVPVELEVGRSAAGRDPHGRERIKVWWVEQLDWSMRTAPPLEPASHQGTMRPSGDVPFRYTFQRKFRCAIAGSAQLSYAVWLRFRYEFLDQYGGGRGGGTQEASVSLASNPFNCVHAPTPQATVSRLAPSPSSTPAGTAATATPPSTAPPQATSAPTGESNALQVSVPTNTGVTLESQVKAGGDRNKIVESRVSFGIVLVDFATPDKEFAQPPVFRGEVTSAGGGGGTFELRAGQALDLTTGAVTTITPERLKQCCEADAKAWNRVFVDLTRPGDARPFTITIRSIELPPGYSISAATSLPLTKTVG